MNPLLVLVLVVSFGFCSSDASDDTREAKYLEESPFRPDYYPSEQEPLDLHKTRQISRQEQLHMIEPMDDMIAVSTEQVEQSIEPPDDLKDMNEMEDTMESQDSDLNIDYEEIEMRIAESPSNIVSTTSNMTDRLTQMQLATNSLHLNDAISSQGNQLVAQNPHSGQYYALTPIQPEQAAQIQAAQLQAELSHQMTKFLVQKQQVFALTPISQEVPVPTAVHVSNSDDAYLISKIPKRPNLLQLISHEPQLPTILSTPIPTLASLRGFVVEQQEVLHPVTFKSESSTPRPTIETYLDRDVNELVSDLRFQYQPVHDNTKYTIYKVKEPSSEVTQPTVSTHAALGYQLRQTPIPIIRHAQVQATPSPTVKFTYRGKPSSKPIVLKSSVNPDYYNSVKAKLFTRPALHKPRIHIHRTTASPPVILGTRPKNHPRKPFRPSPVDTNPHLRQSHVVEPNFSENAHVSESVLVKHQTVHPTKIVSKYLDVDYSPGIVLAPNEAAFAAMQASKLGGPAFIDPGYFPSVLGDELNGKIVETVAREPPAFFKHKPIFRKHFANTRPIPNVEVKELDLKQHHEISPALLTQLLKQTAGGENIELEGYF